MAIGYGRTVGVGQNPLDTTTPLGTLLEAVKEWVHDIVKPSQNVAARIYI
jgi:hypothetical protein